VLSFSHLLKGAGQIVGISDTGADVNSCFFYDPNFPNGPAYKDYLANQGDNVIKYSQPSDHSHRKIVQYVKFSTKDGGGKDIHVHGHGSHTAGSVAGAVYQGDSSYNGMAPEAKLAVFDMGPSLSKLPDPLDINMLPWSYGAGARIHTNSWTSKADYSYSSQAQAVDSFMWNHKDMLVLFSAANKGQSEEGSQLPSPATNKNGITVGATMSTKQHWKELTGNKGLQPSEEVYNIIDDNSNLFSPESLACFSSRGPTRDGRIKPDVVANGFYIVSAKNGQEASTSCSNPLNQLLRALPGTSQSTPTVAGLAALVRQYFADGYYPPTQVGAAPVNAFNASAALVKAMIIASGQRLYGSLDSSCAVLNPRNLQPDLEELSESFPNSQQGFGRVVLSNSVVFFGEESSTIVYRNQSNTDQFGDPVMNVTDAPTSFEICYQGALTKYLDSKGNPQPAKVTLVWTDLPAQPNAEAALVNDLDLTAKDSYGNVYYANGGNDLDHVNNVEQILFSANNFQPQTTLTISVAPYSLQVAQPFSLVLTGRLSLGACSGSSSSSSSSAQPLAPALPSIPRILSADKNEIPIDDESSITVVSVSFESSGIYFRAVATNVRSKKSYKVHGESSPLAFTNLRAGQYRIQVINVVSFDESYTSAAVPLTLAAVSYVNDAKLDLAAAPLDTRINSVKSSVLVMDLKPHYHIAVTFTKGSSVAKLAVMFELVSSDNKHRVMGSQSPLILTGLSSGHYTFSINSLDKDGKLLQTSQPSETVQLLPLHNELYSWHTTPWSSCSKVCGGGNQTRTVSCQSSTGKFVSERYCKLLTSLGAKPQSSAPCNDRSCGELRFEWQISAWSSCSKPCEKGIQKRSVACLIQGTQRVMQDKYCADAPKPLLQQFCNWESCQLKKARANNEESVLGYYYSIGECRGCSASCGGGKCERSVECMIGSITVDDSNCRLAGLIKPPTALACNTHQCQGPNNSSSIHLPRAVHFWRVSSWSECSVGCGGGQQSRQVVCWSSAGHEELDEKCAHLSHPLSAHPCNSSPCPQAVAPVYQWIVAPFSSCLLPSLTKRRWVVCVDTAGAHHDARLCEAHVGKRPARATACNQEEKKLALAAAKQPLQELSSQVNYTWVAGVFSNQVRWCSPVNASQLTATRNRHAFCIGTDGMVSNNRDEDCAVAEKPVESYQITLPVCETQYSWHNLTWGLCDHQDPCKGTQYRQTICTDENGLEVKDKALCVAAKLFQPANQRSPCSACARENVQETVFVPVIGILLPANTTLIMPQARNDLSSDAHLSFPTGINSHYSSVPFKSPSAASITANSINLYLLTLISVIIVLLL
jgi:hypothetical protein